MAIRKSLGSVLLEVFSIVLGVLLALAVSEWQEDREKAEVASTALANISRELAANHQVLEAIHTNNVTTIAAALQAREAAVEEQESQEDRQFIPGIQVRSTAWDAMLSSGASNYIDYDLLLELSETYSMQSIYRQTGLQLVESSMSMAAMATVNSTDIDNQQFQRQFQSYFDMMLQMEEILLANYQATGDLLAGRLGSRSSPTEAPVVTEPQE